MWDCHHPFVRLYLRRRTTGPAALPDALAVLSPSANEYKSEYVL